MSHTSRTNLDIECNVGQWEFKLVVFRGLFKND